MSPFTSQRERRLWIWTLAVVAAIFSTLGLARTLAGVLDDWGGAVTFLFSMFVVGATIVAFGLNVRPGGLEIGVALGVFVAYFMVIVRMSIVTERSHLIEYGVLALFIHEALEERRASGRRVPATGILAIAAASAVGVLDELVQGVLPSRVSSTEDMLFNLLAATMAVTSSGALAWARARVEKRRA